MRSHCGFVNFVSMERVFIGVHDRTEALWD
jgi:hypothetical protein